MNDSTTDVKAYCYKCGLRLGPHWVSSNVAPDAASGGTFMNFHPECAPIVFHGPSFGPTREEVAALKRDADRYRWLRDQNSSVVALIFNSEFYGKDGPPDIDQAIDEAMLPKSQRV